MDHFWYSETKLATSSELGSIFLLDIDSDCFTTLPGPNKTAVTYCKNGLIFGTENGLIELSSLEGKIICSADVGNSKRVVSISPSLDFREFLVGLVDNTFVLINSDFTVKSCAVEMPDWSKSMINVTHLRQEALTITPNGTVYIWDLAKMESKYTFDTNVRVTASSLSPNSYLLAVGSSLGVIRIYDMDNLGSHRLLSRVRVYEHAITQVKLFKLDYIQS
jgi:WD40 repeat protein